MNAIVDAPPQAGAALTLVRDFELRYDDVAVGVPATSQRLLGLLALAGTRVPRAQVGATLWPQADEHHAAASLRSALWRMPATRGRPLVSTSGSGLSLAEHVEVDLHRLLRETRAILATGTPPPELLDADEALRCLGQDLLSCWYDDWVVDERERFRQLRLYSLDVIGLALLEQGRTGEALQVALGLVETDPLRESGQRLLLAVHLQQGNIAEAVRQYERYADLLGRELRARPSDLMTAQLRRCRVSAGRPDGTAVTPV